MASLFGIEPALPVGTTREIREANRPIRDKFAQAAAGKRIDGFSSREAAEAVMRATDWQGVPVKVLEYLVLSFPPIAS